MQASLRALLILGFLIQAFALASPAAGDSSASSEVSKALQAAEELVKTTEQAPASEQSQAPEQAQGQEKGEMASSDTGQGTYPGIKNLRIERGGNGVPSISIYYPEVGNQQVDASLKKFAEDMADAYEKELRTDGVPPEDLPPSYGSWEETGFFTVSKPSPDILSVTFNIYYYTGGAHGQLLISVQNYDLRTGRELKLEDLFAKPNEAIAIMSRLSESRLREALGSDVEEDMLKSGTAPDADNFLNLSLVPEGVVVEFQPYQVGPWSIGQQHVDLSLKELEPAGPNPAIWPQGQK